jgi:uncharacterized protein (TIGR00251 family)
VTESDLRVLVQPNARADAVTGEQEGVWRVRVRAPAVEGKANAALLEFLASVFAIRRRDLTIRSGDRARLKVVRVRGLDAEEVAARLARAADWRRSVP